MAGAVTAETLPVKVDLGEKITAPDDSAFMSL
jgi:benzaldehyde dehydrogenase (NAD)